MSILSKMKLVMKKNNDSYCEKKTNRKEKNGRLILQITKNHGVNFFFKGKYVGYASVAKDNPQYKIRSAFSMVEDVEMYRDSLFAKIKLSGNISEQDYIYPYYKQWLDIKNGEFND
jgi:hypothetical protein